MKKYQTIRHWVADLPKRGQNCFTLQDTIEEFPDMHLANIRNALYRLSQKEIIQTAWHGFYVIIPTEYGLKGVVPPSEYIDQLMKYLGNEYYVGLLNAAAFYGAAHQQPQTFSVIVNTGNLRDKVKKGVNLTFITKKKIPATYIRQLQTRNGYINISTPELTAFDLLLYSRSVGGLNRVSTVLNELGEVMDFQKVDSDFLSYFNMAVIQRMGYILEDILGYSELANSLYELVIKSDLKLRNYPLRVVGKGMNINGYGVNVKWKIIINEHIEIDE